MRCNECENLISDYIDGALELGEQVQVERHLSNCEPCRIVRDDVLQIAHFSRKLPLLTPSGSVWARVRSQIESERPRGAIGSLNTLWVRLRNRSARLTAPQLVAGAAAVVLLIALPALLVRQESSLPVETASELHPGPGSVQLSLLSQQDFARMEQRIEQLIKQVETRKVKWDPELRTAFERNMLNVEQSLLECRQVLAGNPTDPVSKELMINAYREKMRVLEGFSRF